MALTLKSVSRERVKRALDAIGKRCTDILYDLVQPRAIPEHPRRSPRIWVEVLITVLGIAGWIAFTFGYDRVSPTASLDLRYDRGQIAHLAEDYVGKRGFDVQGYRRVTTFGGDWMSQVYLERTVGVSRMNRLVREKQVPLWTWRVRWFVPEQREEYRVNLLPTGEVVGFVRTLAEDVSGEALDQAEAREIAQAYLIADRQLKLDEWELYDVSATTLPSRTDHTLTWVKRGTRIGDGDVRVSVIVQGDRVGQFYTWFRVPEAFSREYTEQRSRAWLLDDVATGLGSAFVAGGVLVAIWGLFSGLRIGWMPVTVGLVVGLVDLLDSLNYLPLINAGYDTALDYRSFILERLAGYANSAAFYAVSVAFLWLASRWLIRAVWPRRHKLVPDVHDRWSAFARSSWRGMMLGGLMGAYLVVFYAVADRLGAWSPVRTPSLNLLATPFPFVAAVWLGLLPALGEELLYRALGMGLVMRLVRGRRWLALLVPSLLWGFAHASYVTDPIWLRGVELTLSSLLLPGLFFLLFDITTTVVAHYVYNASLIAIVLIRSGKPMFVLTGLAAVLIGLVPAVVVLVRRLGGRRRELGSLTISIGGQEDWSRLLGADDKGMAEEGAPRRLVCLRSGDGRLLGYALADVAARSPEEKIGRVLRIYVEEPYRGRYYGTALYRELADWFRKEGVSRVEVQVPLDNAGAATFWSMQRFRPRARVWWGAL